ncbi:MAG TPA: V-type ATP synthase subunit B [Gemmatimonadaceae bacterium]|nr:V-type ATP synthase subunit B [Gemmatimonadaceae bacterium]
MSIAPERTYHGAASAAGPLLFVNSTQRVALNEWVRVRVPGQPDRRGQVIEASERVTIIQLLDDTVGLAPDRADIVLTGDVASTIVGRELLGRAFDGHGGPVDGLPDPVGEAVRSIGGAPLNPVRRERPRDFIETGVSAIDAMNTLVRGQKLPVFAGPGLPALDLAARIVEWARAPHGEPFAVVFAGVGITARETQAFMDSVRASGALPRTVLYLNEAAHPAVERILAPRLALTTAEYLAFECGIHVLVVIADMTHYCEALREIAMAREEIPGRRGYPGYMYTDLATIYERAGIVSGKPGSITQIPIVTMPDDDLTHPIPDLTGYITEGQLVLSRELHRAGVTPPIDVLPSLSRLMSAGIGPQRTRPEHREWSDQLYATYARGREARTMAAIVGESGLPEADRRAYVFAERFEREFVSQPEGRRTLDETFACGWRLLETLPRDDLLRISDATWEARREERARQEQLP